MGRYTGTLHKLIDNASSSNSKTKWNQVLHYLEGHTIANNDVPNPAFDSPLPPYSSPSVDLEVELFDQQGPKREDSPLRIAIKSAPAVVVAALCHMGPEAVRMADSRERLPIHWACRRSSDDPETEKVLIILAKCYPESLLHRDDGGRTPFHWLFWYHAPSRSVNITKFFCQELSVSSFEEIRQPRSSNNERYPLPEIPIPNSRSGIPAIAAIVPDTRHGALPLHYAVMQGVSKDVVKVLINEYPASLAYGDRKRRTPLAWYLGAGHLLDNNKRHICGEANDPNATPWWYVKLSPTLIQLLISSKVARVVDDIGRTPLHWACHFYSRSTVALNSSSLPVKAFQILLDNNIEAVTIKDSEGKTPLHVLFDVVAEVQENDHQRQLSNRTLRDNIDLTKGGPVAFTPSKELVELLLKSPEADGQDQSGFRFDPGREDKTSSTAAYTEDTSGLLPLHTALRVATSPDIIQLLIQSNPTSLVHTSEEELQTPLIHAFCSEYTAPLQTSRTFELLMAAYVTSRHGTFMDGRLALKMEDALGTYPVHYACQNQASLDTIRLFVEKFPRCALFQNSEGDLPLHCLLSQDNMFDPPENGIIRGASRAQPMGLLTDKEVAWQQQVKQNDKKKLKILLESLVTPQHLKIASSAHGMTPLHVAAAFNAVPYSMVYRMLDTYPDAARLSTTLKGHEFSALDLHEMTKNESEDDDEWEAVRELLFSFYPLSDAYRKKEELLEAFVHLIRGEVNGVGSYHMQQIKDAKVTTLGNIDLSETLSSIAMPEVDCAYRPKRKKRTTQPKKKLPTPKKSPTGFNLANSFSFGGKEKVEKSIYDEDLGDRYVVSPQNSEEDDDDDDDLLSSEEEYFSDDDSESDSGEEGTSLEQSSRSRSTWEQGFSTGPSGTYTDKSSWCSRRSGTSSPNKGRPPTHHVEEKKEENSTIGSPRSGLPFLSDVAMRLWCFFVLFNDPKNPDDNYIKQVEAITEDLDFNLVERLISFPLPSYAEDYLEQGTSTAGVTLRDVASPSVKALFHSYHYFLGKYEIPTEMDGVLLHRSSDGNTAFIRAINHVIKTKEYLPKEEFAPGAAEETIWATGENVAEEGGYMTSKFGDSKRSVYFKLTRNQDAYENEVKCREQLGLASGDDSPSNVVPLVENFCASGDGKKDRRYKMDVNDDRFQTLNLFGGESIRLSDFPYALVYPYCDEGDLFDHFFHHGVDGMDEVADIGSQVATALKMMHEKGVVHGNISMRNVSMQPLADDDDTPHRTWAVSDLSNACRPQAETAYMGCISYDGSAQFETGLMPPEMFVKLTAGEVRIYQTYWEMAEKLYKVKVDRRVVEPYVNLETGSTYVLRCHFVPRKGQSSAITLPTLPYQLVPAKESTDVWCFGLTMFTLCSGGHPLCPSNLKTGHLLDYESIGSWDSKAASSTIYEHVQDPLAQDMLLHLLAPYEDRVDLNMETVLNHPFFAKEGEKTPLLGKLIDQRQYESAAHDRWRQQVFSERSEGDWLKNRTTTINCWNFDLLRKIHFSSSEIVRKLVGKVVGPLTMPCSFILLPYKLSAKNKKARLAPTTKKDVERAERMGVLLLSLGKACYFASKAKDVIDKGKDDRWTASKLLEQVTLPSGDFESMKEDFTRLAAAHIEAFRGNPMTAVHKVVERRISDIKIFFKDAGKAFLYLVDEHAGIPLVGSVYAPYPLEIAESTVDQFLTRALPFMHVCTLYALGVSGGVSGLVRLIFEAAYPHVPPSWAQASLGLPHILDENLILKQIKILQESLASLSSSKASYLLDDLQFIRDSCFKLDARGTFADMQRVECAGCSLWTTKEGAAEIQESCQAYGFKEALEIQSALESKLRAQEHKIKKLQADIERLRFRKEFNLEVPDAVTPEPKNSPAAAELDASNGGQEVYKAEEFFVAEAANQDEAVVAEATIPTQDEAVVVEASANTQDEAVVAEATIPTQDEAVVAETPADTKVEAVVAEAPIPTQDEAVVAETHADTKDEAVVAETPVLAEIPTPTKDKAVVAEPPAPTKDEAVVDEAPAGTKDEVVVAEPSADTKDEAVVAETPADTKDEAVVAKTLADTKDEAVVEQSANTKDVVVVAKPSTPIKDETAVVEAPASTTADEGVGCKGVTSPTSSVAEVFFDTKMGASFDTRTGHSLEESQKIAFTDEDAQQEEYAGNEEESDSASIAEDLPDDVLSLD